MHLFILIHKKIEIFLKWEKISYSLLLFCYFTDSQIIVIVYLNKTSNVNDSGHNCIL